MSSAISHFFGINIDILFFRIFSGSFFFLFSFFTSLSQTEPWSYPNMGVTFIVTLCLEMNEMYRCGDRNFFLFSSRMITGVFYNKRFYKGKNWWMNGYLEVVLFVVLTGLFFVKWSIRYNLLIWITFQNF